MSKLRNFFVEEEATTAVEYAFQVTLIVLMAARPIALVGTGANNVFLDIRGSLPF